MHPGDIRTCFCVSEEEIGKRLKEKGHEENYFAHYYFNTVVFPQKGDIPLTEMMSGGDLDGDTFFISW